MNQQFDFLWDRYVSFIAPFPSFLAAMIVSVGCGIIIGIERESRRKPAGIRTLVLICLGSAIFVQLSILMTSTWGDPSRIAAQIVTGIGFLGAGAILHQSEKGYIAGLTTAATIWVTAAIGMLCGAGRYLFGIVAVCLVVLSLRLLRALEKRLFHSPKIDTRRIVFETKRGKTEWKLRGLLEDHMLLPEEYRFEPHTKDEAILRLKFVKENRNHRTFMADIAPLKEVVEIQENLAAEAAAKRP